MKLAQYKEMINNEIKQVLKHNKKWGLKNNVKLRPIQKVGEGRHTIYSADHTTQYCNYLDELKIKYTIGNDSPRGGQLGKYIEIKLDKRNAFIKSLCASDRRKENDKTKWNNW